MQIAYCEDQYTCRRKMLLWHFGERDFDQVAGGQLF